VSRRTSLPCMAILAAALALTSSCGEPSDEKLSAEERVMAETTCPEPLLPRKALPLHQIAADPAAYDGRYVSLTGYYCSGFEESGLYPEPGCRVEKERGFWLVNVSPFEGYAGQKVSIVGRVDAGSHGHLGLWAAQICVSRFTVMDARPTFVSLPGIDDYPVDHR
jgi:hypothetical protein